MYNKKEVIKVVVFLLAIFTLLLSLVDFGYSKYREVYFSEYNKKVYSDFYDYKNQNSVTEDDYKKVCLSLMPYSFYKIHNVINYWTGLFIWLSIFMLLMIKITDKKFKQKIFSKKDKYLLFGIIFLSFFIYYFYVGIVMNSSYGYFTFGCSKFLL